MGMLHKRTATSAHNGNFEQCSSWIRQNSMSCQVQQLTAQYIRWNKSRCAEGALPMINHIATHLKHISSCGRAMTFIDYHGYPVFARWLCPPVQQTFNHMGPRSFRHIRPPLIASVALTRPLRGLHPKALSSYSCLVQYEFLANSILAM